MTEGEKRGMKIFRAAGFEPTPGTAYLVFECGCINTKSVECYTRTNGKRSMRTRGCPEHKGSRILTKYKICSCGDEKIGLHGVVSSPYCAKCAGKNRTGYAEGGVGNSIKHKTVEKPQTISKCKHKKRSGVTYERDPDIDWDILLEIHAQFERSFHG